MRTELLGTEAAPARRGLRVQKLQPPAIWYCANRRQCGLSCFVTRGMGGGFCGCDKCRIWRRINRLHAVAMAKKVSPCPNPDCGKLISRDESFCPYCGIDVARWLAHFEKNKKLFRKTIKRQELIEETGKRKTVSLEMREGLDERAEEEADRQDRWKYEIINEAFSLYFLYVDKLRGKVTEEMFDAFLDQVARNVGRS